MTRFCRQCHKEKPLDLFRAKSGLGYVRQCIDCRERYGAWQTLTPAEKRARMRERARSGIGYFARLVPASQNMKLGGIPSSMTDMASCPMACSFRNHGCYAESGQVLLWWERVATIGDSWTDFCEQVRKLADGQLWRHNTAGDLPGREDALDVIALDMLVRAQKGKRGFTFTHKPLRRATERMAVANANRAGFTINLSADSLGHADALADLEIGPVAVVLPSGASPRGLYTPAGRKVVVCPAETSGLTCAECQLCAYTTRKAVIGFPAHGRAKAIVSDFVQLRRKDAVAQGAA